MWIKICGNTRLQDCLLASDLGANAVGFIFVQGKRTVTAQQVASITSRLPDSIEKIGVFTSTDSQAIAQAANAAGLTGVQLHGEYDPALLRAVRSGLPAARSMRLLQVVHWDLDRTIDAQIEAFTAVVERIVVDGLADALLVDSRTAHKSGGTGRTFDWLAVAVLLKEARLPVIIAGGLTPNNVSDAIDTLKPAGVDVSSGVEDAPGLKNSDAMRLFVGKARQIL